MRGSFTPAVARALTAARSWADAAGRPRVSALDWLAGLLLEEQGKAALLLTEAGLNVREFRVSLALPEPGSAPPELALEADVQSALYAALELALELEGERTISSAALLLALLRQTESLRVLLAQFGLDFAALDQRLEADKLPPIVLEEPLRLAPAGEEVDLARLMDVAANRAREALRVIEDHCRFVLDDAGLSRLCKEMRHDLQAVLAPLPLERLLRGRDTRHDVGTEISTESEQRRESLQAVLRANLKRLQESLRSLEEFAKIHSSEMAEGLEKLRYRAYTLERLLILCETSRIHLRKARLYALLTVSACLLPVRDTVRAWAEGGVDMVQLREKGLDDRQLLVRARQVRAWTREFGLLLIINDRADLARLVEADGVHLGQEDLPVKEARRLLGSEAMIGVSTHNLEQVRTAVLDGADYLGAGPIFPSATKSFTTFAGLDFARAAQNETTLPVFAIGGINLHTLPRVVQAGITRVAVSQALTGTEDPRAVAQAIRHFFPE